MVGVDLMEIVELVKRIREKENPKRAEELISLINARGEGYANYLMGFYDDIHMKYDNVLYGQSGRGVLFVEKNGMYGVTDKNGNEIIPCEFKEYSDAYHKWEKMGSPKEPVVMIEERLAAQQFKNGLKSKHDELVTSGDIGSKIINDVINDNPIPTVKLSKLTVNPNNKNPQTLVRKLISLLELTDNIISIPIIKKRPPTIKLELTSKNNFRILPTHNPISGIKK